MIIRKFCSSDYEIYMQMAEEFYSSEAVLHPVSSEHFERTFREMMESDRYVEGFLFEEETAAGYALLSKTYSQEAGGIVVWLEELYVRPEFQGQGIGKRFFAEYEASMGNEVARLRLEVEADNERAIHLYEKMGYTQLGYQQMYKEIQ